MVATDYGSDIGIDPRIETGDPVKFIDLHTYSGLWTISGTELNLSKVESAVKRVTFTRTLSDSKDRYHPTDQSWLKELATQTRRRVVTNDLTIDPAPIGDLRRFSNSILHWLGEEEERLLQLGESSFERLIMRLVGRMGYHVKPVGDTHETDGGVDIVAWPEQGLPHLVAIEAKHHGVQNNTSVGDVGGFRRRY